MAKIDMTDVSMQNLGHSAQDMVREDFPGGTIDMVGSEVGLSRATTPMGNFDKGISGGRMELMGVEGLVNRDPQRGWDSYPTSISPQSQVPTAKTSGYPRK